MGTVATENPSQAIRVTRVGSHFVGRVEGLDLSQPLTAEQGALVRAAIAEHGVLVFPGQRLDDDQQLRALEDACNVQVMAMAGGAALNFPPIEIARKSAAQHDRNSRGGGGAALLQWAAVRRWMEQVDPSYMN